MKPKRLPGWILTASLALSLGVPAFGTAQEIPSVTGSPTHGRDVFVEKGCLSCHAVHGTGGKIGPDLAAALVGKGIVGIAAAMLNHYPRMNEALRQEKTDQPSLSPAEMDDLVAYLLFIDFAREPGSVEAGRVLFRRKGCTKCHGATLGGQSLGPPLGRATFAAPPILVAQDMWNHGAKMTAKMIELNVPQATFKGHEMADLLAFLGGPVEPLSGAQTPGDPVLGRDLFESKGCARCHLKGVTGEAVGPDLASGRWYETATEIAGAMWNHGPAMWTRMKAMKVSLPEFDDDQMAHVIAYLYLLHSARSGGVPEHGAKLWRERHCARCHDRGGPGPDLATVKQLDTPIHFAAAMWDHAPRMQAFVANAGLAWPVFAASDVDDLVSYLNQKRAEPQP
jgi:mono/diheme cytochrome c family protein